jgi:cellulose synthase subunit
MTRVVLAIALGALLLPSAAVGKTLQDAPRPPGLVRLQFGEHLKIAQEIQLAGTTDARSASFTLPSRWKLLPGSSLHLFVRHSEALDGGRSFLSVTLNYGILRSFRLDRQNAAHTEVVVPIPPTMIKRQNTLVFSVEQFLERDAKSGEIWSSISPRSFLELRFEEMPPELNLGRLPASLLEPHTLSANRLAVLVPRRFDPDTLEATALLVANFSRRSASDRVSVHVVRSLQTARDPLLIVGTPAEQPELGALRGRSPLTVTTVKGRMVLRPTEGPALGEHEGAVALATRAPADPNPILLVSGNSPAAVLRAARSILDPAWSASGTLARVTTDARREPSRVRQWRGFVPPRNSFTLADLDLEDLAVTPERGFSLAVPLDATPDTRFFGYGHRMVLRLKLNPDLFVGDARLLVQVNDVTLADEAVKDRFRRSTGSLSLTIPPHILRPRSVLRLTWSGATYGATQGAVAWLLSTSEFYLPRYYETELPELGLLQSQLYPFSLKGDLSDVIVVLTGDPNDEVFSALIALSVGLARSAPDHPLTFRVRRLSDLSQTDRAESHLLFLNLEDRRDPLSAILPGWKPRPPAESFKSRPVIREMTSPWNRERYVLVISAPSGGQLPQAVGDLFLDANLGQLRGDVAYLGAGRPESFVVGPRHRILEYSYQTLIEAWLRTYWLAVPLILITVSGLLFVGVRLALWHHGRTREPV